MRDKNKIDSQLDKFISIIPYLTEEKDDTNKRIYSVTFVGNINTKIFEALLFGPGKVKGGKMFLEIILQRMLKNLVVH